MQTPYNLTRLRIYRNQGQSPKLPVFVTCSTPLANNMDEVGAMAIRVRPDDSAHDWSAVSGLDVILGLPDNERWTPLMNAIRDRSPRRLRVLTSDGLATLWYGK